MKLCFASTCDEGKKVHRVIAHRKKLLELILTTNFPKKCFHPKMKKCSCSEAILLIRIQIKHWMVAIKLTDSDKNNFETQRRSGTSQHIDLSVEIIDKNGRLEVLRDMWTLIGYMIDTLRNTTPSAHQNFVPKSPTETRTYHSV